MLKKTRVGSFFPFHRAVPTASLSLMMEPNDSNPTLGARPPRTRKTSAMTDPNITALRRAG